MYDELKRILDKLMKGDLSPLSPFNDNAIERVSNEAVRLLNKETLDEYDVMCMDLIVMISQIVYNNTDRSVLFLDDGVYDLLLEKDKMYNSNVQVGAPVIEFNQDGEAIKQSKEYIEPMSFIDNPMEFRDQSLFFDDLNRYPPLDLRYFWNIEDRNSGNISAKKNVNVPHMYPKLVGTLDKCKFVLSKDAYAAGVFNDPTVSVFERDFLGKHLQMGMFGPEDEIELIAELKYDGVSVEADVTDHIISARSRGDTNSDTAADMTHIFGGYRFPCAVSIPDSESFGMKFEAIMTYSDLDKMSRLRGRSYANSRNGIIGLLGSSDVYDYRDLITLVPLATSIEDLDRVTEIEFLNKYYNSGEYLRYSILKGDYLSLLYQVHKFVKEAEVMRAMLPFMYDGVVISYRDPRIIKALGRENSINKYSVAIKFNPLVREAIFTGYTYTVGQDGKVTPMIHYTPVEFLGTIHTKSSGHSFQRFQELKLAKGDIIQVKYTNDVMPYVTKPEVTQNFTNPNPPEEFPTNCPFCGQPLQITDSGKTAFCINWNCPERRITRMANMMAKLNLKDFGEETFRFLGTQSFHQLLNYTVDDVIGLGPVSAEKFIARINEIKTIPMYDYNFIGSIGFTGIAIETWKKIMNVIPINDIINMDFAPLYDKLVSIKGIGPKTADIIVNERVYYMDDLIDIASLSNMIPSQGVGPTGKIIRFTGCRPSEELYMYLTSKGCDARPDGGVIKATDILVVPYQGFSSNKTAKVREDAIIVDMPMFSTNPDPYLL